MKILCRFAVTVLFVIGSTFAVSAQEKETDEKKITRKEVPAAVLAAFDKAYPKAKVVGYSQEMEEGKVAYEVESREGNMTRDVLYYADGSVIVVEETMSPADLPEPVQAAIQNISPAGKIEIAEILKRGSTVQYEVLMKDGTKEFELIFDPSGKLVKREDKKM
jgi:hypothetical protein